MIKITPEQQALLEHIKEQITKALEPYVFEPVSSSSLSLMKETINKTLEPIKVQQDRFSDHVYFILDENKRNMIHMVPHERAPQWVYDVFKLINEKPESYGLDM